MISTFTRLFSISKMDPRVLLGCILFFVLDIRCDAKPILLVTAPKQVRPMSTYTVSLSLYNTNIPLYTTVKITGKDGEASIVNTYVHPEQPTETKHEIGYWKGVNELYVHGMAADRYFSGTQRLLYNSKKMSVFIQTDKAAYQQSQKVQFRVFAIDADLKPFPSNVTVYITDPHNNRIKQYVHATLEKGVFTSDLQLSDKPLLGTWNIKAAVEAMETTKSFSVEEYVLPTYNVKVTTPSFATYNDTATPIRVEAKYTFGKPVRGSVELYISGGYCNLEGYTTECRPSSNINATLGKGGQAVITLDISRLRYPENSGTSQMTISLLAVVTEELTGKTMNDSGSLTIYSQKEKLTLTSTRKNFHPGLPFTIIATLSDQDNKPLVNANGPIIFDISYGSTFSEHPVQKISRNVPGNGLISLDLKPPTGANSLTVTANYKNLIQGTYYSSSIHHNAGQKYILAKIDNHDKRFNVGNMATFHIYTTFDVKQLSYKIVSGGEIANSSTLKFPSTKQHDINVTVTHSMASNSHFIVYTVTDNGDIVVDSIEFAVDGFFRTPVKLSANPHETEPGAPVEIVVDSNPKAIVYMLGIDQNVLFHKSGNDISKQEVEKDFANYDDKQTVEDWNTWDVRKQAIRQLFQHAGLIVKACEEIRLFPKPFWGSNLHHDYSRYAMRIPYDDSAETGQFMLARGYGRSTVNRMSSGSSGYGGHRGYGYSHSTYADSFRSYAAPIEENDMEMFDSEPPVSYLEKDYITADLTPKFTKPQPEPIKLRQNFPETWIWKSISVRNDGKAIFNATAPDTITSWIISAIAMDDNTGLGLSEHNAKVTVFRSFFVSLNLPFSVVRGETLKLQALVFNYFNDDLEANVTLFNENDDFEFTDCSNSTTSCTTTLMIPAGDAASAVFPVVFNTIGYTRIKVSAITVSPIMAGDAIQKELIVKAEGTTKYFNQAVLVDLRQNRTWSSEVEIKVPDDMVPDSERVEVSVIGDILGLTINNIDKLLRVPYGCGEQNMINFVPNIVAANYLRDIGELTDVRKAKAISNIEAGYQRELNYKHDDGSYSAFGGGYSKGSTWLTAYVMKSFAQAKSYIPVNDDIIDKGLQFLQNVQKPDGTFTEHGTVFQKSMQGGTESSGLAMTAYITIAFLQIGNPKYNSTVSKAISALEVRLPNATDPYEVAIITYALHLGNSSLKDIAFDQLKDLSTQEGNLLYWKKSSSKKEINWQKSSTDAINSLDVEATGYSLLTYASRSLIRSAVPIVRWMVGQRNEFGGFASTQDTVIGLEALSTIAGKLTIDSNSTINVDVQYGGRTTRFSVSKENSLVLQQETLPSDTQLVEISATGKGACMLQVTWSYNVFNPGPPGTFSITAEADLQDGDNYNLTVCARYNDEDDESSNMAIIQLNTLSGYSFDKENQPTGARKVEYDLSNTRLNLYYDKIDGSDTCVTAMTIRNNEVEDLKNAIVLVYDYYQQEMKATTYYNIDLGRVH